METVTLHDVLRSLPLRKQYYLKWKFNLWFNEKQLSEEQLLKILDLSSLATFKRWERTPEYKHIVSLILQARQAQDLVEIYEVVKEKVKSDPNPKDVELMLKLGREINEQYKEAQAYFNSADDE